MVIRQFDLCINQDKASRKSIPFFVALQSDVLTPLATIIVAPVYLEGTTTAFTRINPTFTYSGKTYFASMQKMAAIPARQLGAAKANLMQHRESFIKAIDFIFTGI